jgi:hypothetical protein
MNTTQILVAAAVIAVAAVVAGVLARRRRVDAPTQPSHQVPSQLDRRDFHVVDPTLADRPWWVVVFTSATCAVCSEVLSKAAVVASGEVGVVEVEYSAWRDLQSRYRIDAVPMTVVVDPDGVVASSFLGPVTATDLWAAVARARDPELDTGAGCSHDR